MMRVKGLTGPQADSVHRIRGLMAPQAALDSVAAARRQAQIDDIASGTPRLMEKAVARGSWLVKAHHHSEWAVVKYHSGPPFGTAPTSYEPRITNNKKALAVVPPIQPNPGYLYLAVYFHTIRSRDSA